MRAEHGEALAQARPTVRDGRRDRGVHLGRTHHLRPPQAPAPHPVVQQPTRTRRRRPTHERVVVASSARFAAARYACAPFMTNTNSASVIAPANPDARVPRSAQLSPAPTGPGASRNMSVSSANAATPKPSSVAENSAGCTASGRQASRPSARSPSTPSPQRPSHHPPRGADSPAGGGSRNPRSPSAISSGMRRRPRPSSAPRPGREYRSGPRFQRRETVGRGVHCSGRRDASGHLSLLLV